MTTPQTPTPTAPHRVALPRFRFAIISIAACAVFAGATPLLNAQNARQAPAEGSGAARGGGPVTLNFANAEIDAVARTMAVITGRNVVVDPRVKGTMTLVTTSPVSPAQALRLFSTQLRTQGFALVESAGLYLVVPEADAKLQSGTVSTRAVPSASGQILTQIFRLNHETANNLVPVLRPLISPNNTINVNPGNNSLVITDYADNLQRIGTIIAALDVANATGVEIIRLQHAIATDLAPLVTRLIDSGSPGGAGQGDTSFKTTLLAEPRSNSLILRAANPARLALVRTLVEKLDQAAIGDAGANGAAGNIYVVYLKNADATKLASTLRAAMAANAGGASSTGGLTALGAASPAATFSAPASVSGGAAAASSSLTTSLASAQPSTGGQIQADPSTNSLIITASEPQYRQLRAVIDKLDARRAQVFVESLIAEVNADKAAEFGIQFQGPIGKKGDGSIGLLGTNFSIGGANLISLATQGATGNVLPSTGVNFGVANRTNGVYVLGFLARFLEANGDGNILSTPNLLTLDNEEARIVVGQNVPFLTGSFTNAGSGNNGSVNPFQTIERKDVGLTLRVKPQISENGTVKLQIFQEVSSVQASSINSSTGLITNKRSIESNVLVEDGAIVVLGGLLQDEYSGNQEKVPGLGDIPFFGNLFKAETRSRKKTNLMVFLRPVVVRDASATESLSMDRYDLMRNAQKDAQPASSVMVPVNEAPVMPPLRPGLAPLTSLQPPVSPAAPAVPTFIPGQ
ncbi:type II secretion system secretin GspD [Polaromonas sp.]|uniref:type II secretion system secretin GspD n=1 Tax=Polaromonas sp. TaxID=1869339 RepID=UPI00286A7966|nr:type II secretion system secretin GspD [Polaromonas sp.]